MGGWREEEEELKERRGQFVVVMKRSTPDEGFDDGDEGFDVPGGMNHEEALQVLPQPVNTHLCVTPSVCV